MFFIISKLLSFLLKPILWILILLTSALIFKNKRKKLLYITLFVLYFFTNSFIADSISRIWEVSPKAISSLSNNYKYGIVLGGYSSYNTEIEQINLNESGDRLISAIELYNLGKIEKIIISGGNGELINNGMKEAEWSKEFLINMGVKKMDILLESSSKNTMENAQNTAVLIKNDLFKKSLLITSSQHMRRAKFCFNQNNFNLDCYPIDCTSTDIILSYDYLVIPNINALYKWETIIHEFIGYIVYRIKF